MVCPVWLPDIAHFTIPPPLCLIAHVEAPVGWNNTWICANALKEGCAQVHEQNVVDEEKEDCIPTPKLRPPDKAHVRYVNAQDDTYNGGNKAHAIEPLSCERSRPLHGFEKQTLSCHSTSVQTAGPTI
mmetsp:Transcript_66559/g.118284  ORF Transcript_66559/g.118284 Transcript_66559/m.118284 type:complete len:128 (+) Transcript_66559:557-940(+)